ncbi:MAG: hypothetical protein GY873_03050 [Bosea sp.]|uniref:hypothetical protein n=1 Tax=Bosea sp. (in: a-proteobacteria) TaxID=1871050 RepID=UPI0023A45B32|nr:hypothetical protein [Bosea sp. (in: a-proteobacteria)]MCP4733148.1 hypothetical protein [Bosea sp. (in: a-proteobacteria)]
MVSLDSDADGIVTLRFAPPYADNDERAYLDALAELGRRQEPFLLLTVFGGGRKLSQAGEREQAIWFKRTRAQFGALCGACAIVRPGATETMADVFRRLWPFPISLETDEAAARAFLLKHRRAA